MSDVTFRSDMTVECLEVAGSDASIIQAMLVSSQGIEALDAEADFGRINFLMKNRHGSPFEHAMLKFYVEAPIAVFREWHRHRIGQSYNEVSGRYRELDPVFYLPSIDRPLMQQGKPGSYTFVPGNTDTYNAMRMGIERSCRASYDEYKMMLECGVAKEVARGVLPVYTYSAMIVTMNPRSAMSFLSLRQQFDKPNAMFPSKPMWEIARCADEVEGALQDSFPLTHRAFVKNGRVSP